MSDIEITGEHNLAENDGHEDVEMGGDEVVDIDKVAATTTDGDQNGHGENGQEISDEEDKPLPARVTYVDHLKSPIVELIVGQDNSKTVLSAHQALLVQSPFFENACDQFPPNTPVWYDTCTANRNPSLTSVSAAVD
jgi:hypothetical protein